MRFTWALAASLVLGCASASVAQQFELGGLAGYSWDHDASIRNATGSVEAGFKPGFSGGAVFGDNMYEHIGGEIRWLYRVGGPQLTAPGIKFSESGFTNLIHYDLLIHTARKEDRLRPFFAAGAGIKVYTGPSRPDLNQPLTDFAFISHGNHVEPLISLGTGLKYRVHRGVQLRLDFRAYLSPCPSGIFRTPYRSDIHGWIYDFTPTLGVSYLF